MNHYVYEITNLINGKKYIGKRSCKCPIEKDRYMGSGKMIKIAIKKYGVENFKKEILQTCENEQMAYEWEKVYIEQVKAYNNPNYYNITSGGIGFKSGETRGENNKRARKVVCLNTMEVFECMQYAAVKYNITSGSISRACSKKISYRGVFNNQRLVWVYYEDFIKMNDEQIKKSIEKANTCMKGKNHPRSKKIINIKTHEIFDSITDASIKYNVNVSTIIDCCLERRPTATGTIWMYLETYNKMTNKEVESIINRNDNKYKIINLNTHQIYTNAKEIENTHNIDTSSIYKHIRGELKSAGKINGERAKWMYYEDYLKVSGE